MARNSRKNPKRKSVRSCFREMFVDDLSAQKSLQDGEIVRVAEFCDIKQPMADNNEILFEVETPLGFRVRVTVEYWNVIVAIKHPVIRGREADVQDVLRNPDEIRLSKRDPGVYLFYKSERIGRWVCAVTKRLDGEGFLITAYPTDAVKEGERIWRR